MSSLQDKSRTLSVSPGDRGSGASFIGTDLVYPDTTTTLRALQPRTDCLQISDLGLADG